MKKNKTQLVSDNGKLRKQIEDKENAMKLQMEQTDELRNENRELRTLLTRVYWQAVKGLPVLKEHAPEVGLKLGKELHRTKVKYLETPHRN